MPTPRTIDPICAALRQERLSRRRSQQDVAAQAGTSRETLNGWENGAASPSLDWLRKWAKALGMSPLVTKEPTSVPS